MKGLEVTLFDDGRRPELIVGESLIPGVIPMLRKLGLEERAAAICQHKPGVTFTLDAKEQIDFCFESLAGTTMPTYAYNAPRPAFDQLFDQRADELGVNRVRVRAKIERAGTDGLRLAAETLEQAPALRGRQPDFIVDATGRSRLFAHTLEIPAEVGPRKDVAYFAHYEGFQDNTAARTRVIIGRLAEGWSWRIPLPGRLSVGVVLNKDAAAQLGATPEERLEAAISRDPDSFRGVTNRRQASRMCIPIPITSWFPSAATDRAGRCLATRLGLWIPCFRLACCWRCIRRNCFRKIWTTWRPIHAKCASSSAPGWA